MGRPGKLADSLDKVQRYARIIVVLTRRRQPCQRDAKKLLAAISAYKI